MNTPSVGCSAVYNPENKPVDELPEVFGFNNGGSDLACDGVLVAEDGTYLGSHMSTNERFMLEDLGIIEGSRPDRHQDFQMHYPRGYRMTFVGYDAVPTNAKLMAALKFAEAAEATCSSERLQ